MQVLVVQLGAGRFGLPLRALGRVLPAAGLAPVPGAPAAVAGLLNLHGAAVPVLDFAHLAGATPGPVCADSRIVLLPLPAGRAVPPDAAASSAVVPAQASAAPRGTQFCGPAETARTIGLLAEHVLGIERIDPAALADSGVASAPFVGRVVATAGGLLQLVEPEGLMTPALRAALAWPEAA